MTTSLLPAPASVPTRRSSPWTEIGVFLGVVVALTATTTTIALTQHADVRQVDSAPPGAQAALYSQALIPVVAAVVARLVGTGTLRRNGWGLRRSSWRSLGIAWAWSLGTTVGAGAIVWVTGAGGFRTAGLDAMVPLGLTALVLPYVLLAIGEDIGWRGLLVTRLAEVAGPRTVVLVGGLIWSAFHWPLILVLGGTPTAVLYHVAEPLTRDTGHTNWVATETGLAQGVVMVVGAAVFLRFFPLVRGTTGGTVAGRR